MLFNSLAFVIFFPIVATLYFLLPHRARWAMLLFASCVFYMAFIPKYILILATTIVVDYFAGIQIEKSEGRRRKLFLILSIVSNIGFLAFFKYANFIGENINALASFLHWNYSIPALAIILPIGLSFHTFQALSYIIEVYRGKQKAERHFGIYALYVMFFPQLVAGPIERPQNLLPQFHATQTFNRARVASGLRLMLWGFFKKMVVADTLASGVNVIFNNPHDFGGTSLLIATIFFAFQIYCDFSGYSDIALGAARVLGFTLMQNFNDPYHARSISDFWKRWHISLSTWFRDYLYIPLGGNRVSTLRNYLNLVIVFTVSGLWHGANWTFIVWGALHGTYLVTALLLAQWRARAGVTIRTHISLLENALSIITTFSLVSLGWIFFRATSLHDALYIVTHLFSGLTMSDYALTLTKGRTWLLYALSAIVIMEGIQILKKNDRAVAFFLTRPAALRYSIYALMVLAILLSGNTNENQFIYFQF
jgi:D-alanyl-lipoteichoic acid acyltransferase DltB (MBOAT superfamily)